MASVLLLGAGLVTRPLVRYLLDQPGLKLSIASRTVEKAEALLENHPQGRAIAFLVDDDQALARLVGQHDLTISLLPYTYHVRVAKQCSGFAFSRMAGRHLWQESYFDRTIGAPGL